MPVTERRTRRRLALREAILEAARAIVRDEGLRALTMRKIAEAVDYAPASLYAHFASREALLAELCGEGMRALRIALEDGSATVKDPRARLVALGNAYVAFALARPDTFRLMFMEDAAITKSIFENLESDDGARALGLIGAAFAELRASGSIKKTAHLARLTDTVWTIVHGIACLRLGCPTMPATPDGELIASAFATILDGCASTPARSPVRSRA
jgi:AcrR family transcriptional regulator